MKKLVMVLADKILHRTDTRNANAFKYGEIKVCVGTRKVTPNGNFIDVHVSLANKTMFKMRVREEDGEEPVMTELEQRLVRMMQIRREVA